MNVNAPSSKHLLLLAGSGEARVLAQRLAEHGHLRVTASLLIPPRSFGPLTIPTRIGDFGDADGLKQFVADEGITAMLDATHPFATQISQMAAQVCTEMRLPHAQVLRPQWQPQTGDHWISVKDEAAAAKHLSANQRVFTNTGRATLAALVDHCPAQFFVRLLEPHFSAPDHHNVTFVLGNGPFSVQDEVETLRNLKIDLLVVRNSGGLPSRTKLDAARELGIKVILIERPPLLDVTRLETIDAALDWIDAL